MRTRELGPKLQCLLKVKDDSRLVLILLDAKNNVSNLLKSKQLRHNDIFDHKYCIDPGNLLNIKWNMLKYQYLT